MQRLHGGAGREVRTLFLSDVHLGSKHSQCQQLLHFLQDVSPRQLYIVGDFIDGWQLKRCFRWLPAYNRLLERLSDMAHEGTQVFYMPGNHDEFVRNDGFVREAIERMGFIEVAEEFVFETSDRRRFLVTHGDRFDYIEQSMQWLSIGVTGIYNVALSLNWCLAKLFRQRRCSPYWLCARIKDRVKAVIRFISHYEESLLRHAQQQGCDGVICGHLHTPSIVHRRGMTYCNTGDWVENCTALCEYDDGTLEIAYYYPQVKPAAAAPAIAPAPSRLPVGASPPVLQPLSETLS